MDRVRIVSDVVRMVAAKRSISFGTIGNLLDIAFDQVDAKKDSPWRAQVKHPGMG